MAFIEQEVVPKYVHDVSAPQHCIRIHFSLNYASRTLHGLSILHVSHPLVVEERFQEGKASHGTIFGIHIMG